MPRRLNNGSVNLNLSWLGVLNLLIIAVIVSYCSNTLCHNSLTHSHSLHYTSHHTTPCMYLCTYVRRNMIKFLNKYCSYLRRFLRAQIKALTLLVDKTNSLCRFSFTITVLLRQCVYRMYPNSGGAAPPQPHDDCDTIKTVQGSCWTKCSSTIHHPPQQQKLLQSWKFNHDYTRKG